MHTRVVGVDALGVDAFRFAELVSAEGVPLAGPYIGTGRVGPLYRNPFLAEPSLYGDSQFPLDYRREQPIDYRRWQCPQGEALMSRNCNLSMRPTFTPEDVEDIAGAIRKVATACRARRFG